MQRILMGAIRQLLTRRGPIAKPAIAFHKFCESVGEGGKKRQDNHQSDGHSRL